MDNEFFTQLKDAMNNVVNIMENRLSTLDDDIEKNVAIIQTAYDSIKADKKEVQEIESLASDFARKLGDVEEDSTATADNANVIINDCYDLYEDGYIHDEELDKELATNEEDEVEEPLEIKDENDNTEKVAS